MDGVMPKETVKYPKYEGDWRTEQQTKHGTALHIGWTRGGDAVQLLVTNFSGETDDDEVEPQVIILTRRNVNDILRRLRVARDEAFGRDE